MNRLASGAEQALGERIIKEHQINKEVLEETIQKYYNYKIIIIIIIIMLMHACTTPDMIQIKYIEAKYINSKFFNKSYKRERWTRSKKKREISRMRLRWNLIVLGVQKGMPLMERYANIRMHGTK